MPNAIPSAAAKTAHEAAHEGDLPALRSLVASDPAVVASKDGDGRVPLHWAVSGRHADAAAFLLGADKEGKTADAPDESGWTPLMIACSVGEEDIVKKLLEADVDPTKKTDMGTTALHYAASKNRLEAAAALLAAPKKANVNARDNLKQTPLHRAAGRGNEKMILLLAENGADLDAEDGEGRTPLHLACDEGHGGAAKALLEAGADRDIEDKEGKKPFDLAEKNVRGYLEKVIV
ncbi:ankyrin repeat-containing domain protein [Hyaloraphidium curvatum]|nr:ankyrin repeat-containing domain protein [Hyaloraphidium curvatum]